MKKTCVLVDLDGTIFDLTHRLHFILAKPKNWPAFFRACVDDTPITDVIEVIRALYLAGYEIIFVTGRSEEVRAETLQSLHIHLGDVLARQDLYMRKALDFREDNIVKQEILDSIFPGTEKNMILGVFEDRQQVVDMYRSNGLRVFQVAKGDF